MGQNCQHLLTQTIWFFYRLWSWNVDLFEHFWKLHIFPAVLILFFTTRNIFKISWKQRENCGIFRNIQINQHFMITDNRKIMSFGLKKWWSFCPKFTRQWNKPNYFCPVDQKSGWKLHGIHFILSLFVIAKCWCIWVFLKMSQRFRCFHGLKKIFFECFLLPSSRNIVF